MKTKPFPFFGAGYAEYLKEIGLTIVFKQTPTQKQIWDIIENPPEIFTINEESFHQTFLIPYTEDRYFIAGMINSLYGDFDWDSGTTPADVPVEKESFIAFNEDIENWLQLVNTIAPILFVYRPESLACEVEYSKWHYNSKDRLEDVVLTIEDDIANAKLDYYQVQEFKKIFRSIYKVYGENPKRFNRKVWKPLADISFHIQQNSLEQFIVALAEKSDDALAKYLKKLTNDEKIPLKSIYQFAKSVNDSRIEYHFYSNDPYHIQHIIHQAIVDNENILLEKIATTLLKTPRHDRKLSGLIGAYYTHKDDKEKMILDIYSLYFILNYVGLWKIYPSQYFISVDISNVLYLMIESNHALDISDEIKLTILDKCVPFGKYGPILLWNASCIYAELGETQKSWECIYDAFRYRMSGSSQKEFLNDIEQDISFKLLRQQDNYNQKLEFLKNKATRKSLYIKRLNDVGKEAIFDEESREWIVQKENIITSWYFPEGIIKRVVTIEGDKTFYKDFHLDGTLYRKYSELNNLVHGKYTIINSKNPSFYNFRCHIENCWKQIITYENDLPVKWEYFDRDGILLVREISS